MKIIEVFARLNVCYFKRGTPFGCQSDPAQTAKEDVFEQILNLTISDQDLLVNGNIDLIIKEIKHLNKETIK